MTEPADESLANFWSDWPESARRYREQKRNQVERLQQSNNVLHAAIRQRDTLLLEAAQQLDDFVAWWLGDDLDGVSRIDDLSKLAARLRGVLRT